MSVEGFDIVSVLLKGVVDRIDQAKKSQTRFVHYTSAEVGISIIRNKKIWMRNASCMNDRTEMTHGIDRVVKFFDSSNAAPMWAVLEGIHVGIQKEMGDIFASWIDDIRNDTYLTCVSEHPNEEDDTGRLSMWRAYGKTGGVAIVLNPEAMLSSSDALHAYSFPVHYYSDEQLSAEFSAMVGRIRESINQLAVIDREVMKSEVFRMLLAFCVCLKHPGFKEEREWRVVYRPNHIASKRLKPSIETVDGTPQRIYKIPLENVPDEGFLGANPDELFSRVIIGPCAHPMAVWDAYVEALREVGVTSPEERVRISNLPLRT